MAIVFRRSSHIVKMPKFSKISQTEKKILNETLRHVTYLENCIFFEVSCWAVNFFKVYMIVNKLIFFLVKRRSCTSFQLEIEFFEKVIKFWNFLMLRHVTYTKMSRNVHLWFFELKSLRQEKKMNVQSDIEINIYI